MDKIDYIIPTWNSGATLELTIKSIEKYGYPNQIIIVDRNSSDNTLDIAQRHSCKIIQSTKPLGGARLDGAKAAETELIGFVDSDVEIKDDWVELLKHAQERKYDDAGVFGAYYEGCLSNTQWPIKLDGGNGAFGCSITYRSLVLECQNLERFSSAEDGVYARFLSQKGFKWYILPVSVIHHQELTGIPSCVKWRWLGAGLRMRDGFHLVNIRRILGGAVAGIRMNNLDISYWENWRIRLNYFIGYLMYKKYYEIRR